MIDETVEILIDGRPMTVAPGTTVAAALLNADVTAFRNSLRGEPRGPLCGMGICFECRVTVNGWLHRRACLIVCTDGLRIDTGTAP